MCLIIMSYCNVFRKCLKLKVRVDYFKENLVTTFIKQYYVILILISHDNAFMLIKPVYFDHLSYMTLF